jgi:N-acetylglucosaminyldiphosphoundecaprenol N-acetyl-beta-D-mannosaminyltransferase
MLHSIKLLGTTVTDEKEQKVLEYVVAHLHNGREKLFITTPNPEILVYAQAHPDYQNKLNSSGVALADGIGLLLGGWVLGKPITERITGVDFMEKLCRSTREKPVSMGFLGGRSGVAELTAERLKKKYPWINVVFVSEEWSATDQMIDILFVAYGFPKQEEWIYENLPKLPVKAAMGVGGAFDYLSGKVVRAPKLIRAIGLEWFFRLCVQPWRFKRQLALITFLFLILKVRFTTKK